MAHTHMNQAGENAHSGSWLPVLHFCLGTKGPFHGAMWLEMLSHCVAGYQTRNMFLMYECRYVGIPFTTACKALWFDQSISTDRISCMDKYLDEIQTDTYLKQTKMSAWPNVSWRSQDVRLNRE